VKVNELEELEHVVESEQPILLHLCALPDEGVCLQVTPMSFNESSNVPMTIPSIFLVVAGKSAGDQFL